MVFCCIAIVAIAIVYFIGLWIRQLFLGRRRDLDYAFWPPPPRALAGNGAWPVYGHTRLFRRHVGDVALRFDPAWTEFGPCSKRKLGDCFAVAGTGAAILQHQTLHEGWPWTPPVTLLGKSCMAFLQQDDPAQAQGLRELLQTPLCAKSIQRFAPQFAKAAEQCLVAVEQGLFRKVNLRTTKKQRPNNNRKNKRDNNCGSPLSSHDDFLFDDEELEEGACCKLKWEALRSYSLDLLDGSLFQMNLWKDENNDDNQMTSARTSYNEATANSQATKEDRDRRQTLSSSEKKHDKSEGPPSRELMLLWMERIKLGLDVIKLTFGPEWMYVWMFNEYGRAINARMYVEKLVSEHVERMVALVPQVTHERGHAYHEPTTQPFPLLAMHKNLMHSKEGIFGDFSVYPAAATMTGKEEAPSESRMRCNSMPNTSSAYVAETSPPPPINKECLVSPYVKPFKMEQDLARPNYESSPKRRPMTVKPDYASPDGTLVKERWGLDEIRLQESLRIASLSPLSEGGWNTSPVPQWESRKMALSPLDDDDESLTKMVVPLKVEEEAKESRSASQQAPPLNGTKKTHQKKRVDDVFNEIKANREKQKHMSHENQVVYSFFNPAKRKTSADDETAAHVIKVVTAMPDTKLLETEQSQTPVLPAKIAMAQEHITQTSSQPLSQTTNVNNKFETSSKTPERNGKYKRTSSLPLNESAKDSRMRDDVRANGTAPSKITNTAPKTPMPPSCRPQRMSRNVSTGKKKVVLDARNANVCSLLEALLQQKGPEGKGISQTTLVELTINLWMMLEVGNAWTAMALNLLAWDETSLGIIQEELDVLEMEFGNELFSPASLDRMKYLDALIYESIRLIPPFLGGLKSTTETVLLPDAGVQIPKGSHIFFCQPSRQEFNLFAAVGKRPECLGQTYPCIELFGFLPLQGLEVPLMVLQCKAFLIVTLRNYAPSVSKRKTFIRRVKSAVSFRKSQHGEVTEASMRSLVGPSDVGDAESGSNYSNGTWDLEDGAAGHGGHKMTPSEAMKRFTKIPFPEPKRVIQLVPRGL